MLGHTTYQHAAVTGIMLCCVKCCMNAFGCVVAHVSTSATGYSTARGLCATLDANPASHASLLLPLAAAAVGYLAICKSYYSCYFFICRAEWSA